MSQDINNEGDTKTVEVNSKHRQQGKGPADLGRAGRAQWWLRRLPPEPRFVLLGHC